MQKITTRRGFFGGTAAACLAGAIALPVLAASSPDAELLALGAEHRRLIATINDPDNRFTDEEINRLLDRSYEIEDRIMEIEPQTIAGLAAQIFVCWRIKADHEEQPHSGPDEDACFDIKSVWIIIKNAERLAGGALA